MSRKFIFPIIIVVVIFGVGMGVYFSVPKQEIGHILKEAKRIVAKDSDGDGVPDNEDDYPNDSAYRAKLKVTKSNWYRINNEVYVVLEYKNTKPYTLYWVLPYVNLKRADGVIFKSSSARTSINAYPLASGEKGYGWINFYDPEKKAASYGIEVKGESYRGYEEKEYKKTKAKVLSSEGTFPGPKEWPEEEDKWVVSGIIENREEGLADINVWVGFYAKDGTLLDIQEESLYDIPAGEKMEFSIKSRTPQTEQIDDYEILLTCFGSCI